MSKENQNWTDKAYVRILYLTNTLFQNVHVPPSRAPAMKTRGNFMIK